MKKFVMFLLGLAAFVGVSLTAINAFSPAMNTAPASAIGGFQGQTSSANPTSTVAAKPVAAASECPDSRPVYVDPNLEFSAVTGGVKSDAEIRMHMDREPAYLAYAAHGFLRTKYPTTPDWKTLVTDDGKCFNVKGMMLRAEIDGALSADSGTVIQENVAIPMDYFNTGMENGQPVVNKTQGIPSGRVGTKYTQQNGTETYVDHHCANIPEKGVPRSYKPVYFPPAPQVVTPPRITNQPPPTFYPPTTTSRPCSNCTTTNQPPPVCTRCECNNSCPTTTTPPPVCTRCECNNSCPTTTTLAPKLPSRAPGQPEAPSDGGFSQNGGGGAPAQSDPVGPPAAGYTPPVYQQPVTPVEAPAPAAPVIAPVIIPPAAQPTVDAGAQSPPSAPSNGSIDTSSPVFDGAGEFG